MSGEEERRRGDSRVKVVGDQPEKSLPHQFREPSFRLEPVRTELVVASLAWKALCDPAGGI